MDHSIDNDNQSENQSQINKPIEYWAAGPTRECGDEVLKKAKDYWTFQMSHSWFTNYRRAFYAYNPNRYTQGQTVIGGESNEYRTIKVNHFKNLLEHVQTLSITDRPVWQPQSVNSDSTSLKQCIIANGVLEYYMREKRIERHLQHATRNALLFSEGFVMTLWDPSLGKVIAVDPATQEKTHEGDIAYTTLEPVDVIRDPNLKSYEQRSWITVRTYVSKYDLAAKFPEYSETITAQTSGITEKDHYLAGNFLDKSLDSDLIPLLTFFHSKTSACPQGRQMELLMDGTILSDGILPYSHIPVHRIAPNDQIGSPFGQSVSFDLLPLQEMIDAHYATILSINENYSIPKILMPIGSDIQADSLSAGFQVIGYNPQVGKPEVMEMPTAPDGLFKAMQLLQQEMETLSGVNSVSRGNPEASLKSGAALALVQSMAIQFNQPLQNSYIALLEDVGTATLQILKDYAAQPRLIQIAGKNNKGIMQQAFTGKDIDSISRVQVQVGNALSKTVSGRLSIAQDLLTNHIITNSAEYLMVLETGTLEPMVEGPTKELLSLKSENEMLGEGSEVPVLFTDNHVLHIQEHTALASDPIVRSNPQQFAVISQHIQQHLAMLADPQYQSYRQLMGQPTLPGQAPQPQGAPSNVSQQVTQPQQAPMNGQDIQNKAQNINMPKPAQAPQLNKPQ